MYNAATLAIINEYYIGTARQRALSYWSIGSWGGSGVCTLFGGLMATNFGWRSILLSLLFDDISNDFNETYTRDES